MFAAFGSLISYFVPSRRSVIQPGRDADLPVLAEIHASSFARGWSDGDFERLMGNDNYFCFVARAPRKPNKPPAGFVFVRSIIDEAEIITIATKPSARRRGVARQLMQAAIRQLEHDRRERLFLEVDEANTAAIALYKSLGFKQVGKREGYYVDGQSQSGKSSTALVMQLQLD